MRQKYVCAAWFGLHFLLIISFSCRETLGLIARGLTIFPSSFKSFAQKAETVADAVLGQHLAASNAVRQALATYLHIAGIETGYGYFAPNVPGSYKLVFELHYPDGRVEYECAHSLRHTAPTSGENDDPTHLAPASRGEDDPRRVWINQFAQHK